MKDRPILFSGAMVRALLDGSKTQTRRFVKLTDSGRVKATGSARNWHLEDPNAVLACPYGQPGDRLWVRETFGIFDSEGTEFVGIPKERPRGFHVVWAGDCPAPVTETFRFRPSIHMPRWASRITLEITAVRVERLQEISEEDAKAEGVDWTPFFNEPVEAYADLWKSINGPCSWESNPYVWVIEFKRITQS